MKTAVLSLRRATMNCVNTHSRLCDSRGHFSCASTGTCSPSAPPPPPAPPVVISTWELNEKLKRATSRTRARDTQSTARAEAGDLVCGEEEEEEAVELIDCSWLKLPSFCGRDARQEFDSAERLPGAAFLDLDSVSDCSSPFPHNLPPREQFIGVLQKALEEAAQRNAGKMPTGRRETHFVLYDSVGVFSSPRFWWMFKVFGFDRVSVLDGGLPKWKAEGHQLECSQAEMGSPEREEGKVFLPSLCFPDSPSCGASVLTCSYEEVRQITQQKERGEAVGKHVVDCRSVERFEGRAPEPRADIPRGHIPFSSNLPFTDVLQTVTVGDKAPLSHYTVFKSKEELCDLFRKHGFFFARDGGEGKGSSSVSEIVCSCGSGVTAAIVLVALHHSGAPLSSLRLFDGSWAEYAQRSRQKGGC